MSNSLLVDFYSALPEDALRGGLDWPIDQLLTAKGTPRKIETRATGKARRRAAIHIFCKQVRARYNEGTLLRLLEIGDVTSRRAATFALGLLGSLEANESLALQLHHEDDEVARLASEALWALWFRGENATHSEELYRILRNRDREEALVLLDDLIIRAPKFAEAFNQRAIIRFQLAQYARSAADCAATLRLNPQHFGAQAGLGHCLLNLRKQRAALRAFRVALLINPRLDGVACTIKTLETGLEEGQ